MKPLIKHLLIITSLCTGLTAEARSLRRHNPYRIAIMEVTQANGEYSKDSQVKLTEWATFSETLPLKVGNLLVLEVNGVETGLTINSVEVDGCGSSHALAISYGGGSKKDQMTISLTDHTKRKCKDIQPARWMAKVELAPLKHSRLKSTMNIIGNPDYVAAGRVLSAPLKKHNIDPNVWFAKSKLGDGTITVDLKKNELTLFITTKFYCPPGRMCPAVMPPPIAISLPITKVASGECGTTMYEAFVDKRPVDGAFEGLQVSDNREFRKHCTSITAVPGVEVTYETKTHDRIQGREVFTHSEFTGDGLMPINQ